MADATTNTARSTSLHRITPLHGTENYNTWRIQMEDILTDLDLYQYVSRSTLKPPKRITVTVTDCKDENGKTLPDMTEAQDNEAYTQWVKADRKALLNICLRVDGHVLTHIQKCAESAEAWDLLSSNYQIQSTMGLIGL
jgi:hypothetical protein